MKMIINKVKVPESAGGGKGRLIRRDGEVIMYERGSKTDVFLFREKDGEDVIALCATVNTPVTRAKCINAAEMAAYGLLDAMDVASFNASLSRKARCSEDMEEVVEHDDFIRDVKVELTNIGVL